MTQYSFPSDIFGFINGIFILAFVIVIIFFIIVVVIVYKLLHSNVDNVKKKSRKVKSTTIENSSNALKEISSEELKSKVITNTCKYCGDEIEEGTTFCPYCGSNLAN